MSLQDELYDEIKNIIHSGTESSWIKSGQATYKILSLPTGMVKVEKCKCDWSQPCTICNGTRLLIRPLTLQEKCDIVDMLMEWKAFIYYKNNHLSEEPMYIELPDGSKVRRGK
jgi:hypothetical protein